MELKDDVHLDCGYVKYSFQCFIATVQMILLFSNTLALAIFKFVMYSQVAP